ncbi:glycosyltransferase family 1 protein [Candidatus Uhrbacteria bacterium]|nr:MAG: glycosyltransferase family 1 protein [Candidatus Uhrbacteria bacterium]
MRIGIEASRANRPVKTGVEWYAWHVIQGMKELPEAARHEFWLYTNDPLKNGLATGPSNWKERRLPWPPKYLWTQARLSWEMVRRAPGVLFVPAHVLPAVSPKKSVVTIHDVGFKRFPEVYKKIQVAYHEITTRDIVRRRARIITVSEFCKREIVELYGADPEKIFVTPLGLDHERFVPQVASRKSQVAEKYGIKGPYLLFVGRIDKKKNLPVLVKAFDMIADEYPEIELVLAGTFSGPSGLATTGAEDLKRVIRHSKFAARIKLLGYLDEADKPALLSAAAAYVQPSIYEGFGLPPLEAMACGTPAICANAASLPEVIGKGNALFFAPKHPDELAEAIRNLLASDELRRELVEKGLARAKEYDWRRTAAETLRMLESW